LFARIALKNVKPYMRSGGYTASKMPLKKEPEPETIFIEEEPEEIEKEKPALDTEFWNQKGQTFSATAYAKDKAGKRVIVKGVDWTPASLNVEDAIEKVSDAFAQVAGSPSELKAMKTELRKMGIPS
jgi:hypothetical protein